MIGVLLILVLILACLLYKIGTRNFSYWKQRKVVHPKPIPFLGNYADFIFLKMNLGFVTSNIYNKYPGEKYVGALLGKTPVLVVRDPDLIKLITTKDYYSFNDRGFAAADPRDPVTMNLLNLTGDHWRVLRQNLTPLFSSTKMRNMFHLIKQSGCDFEELLHRKVAESDEIDMRDALSRFSMDVIGSCAFGIQMDSLSGEDTEFRKVAFKIFNQTPTRVIKLLLRFLSPWILNVLNVHFLEPDLEKFFADLVRNTMKTREGRPPERHDFIDLLAQLKQRGHIEGDSIENMRPGAEQRSTVSIETTDILLTAQSFVFFVAGFETSSTTMNYTLYELAKNPDIQERLHAEIDSLLGKHEGQITYEMLKEASYLEMVMSEAMRKYPVLSVITRECTGRYTMPDGVVVEPGVKIHLPVYALHHDPQYYPEPDIFDPERFSPEASRDRNPYTYMPFGEGQRMCIGMRFGKMQVKVGLITLLRNYSVEPCARTENNITFDAKANITTPKNKVYLKLKPRLKLNNE